VNLDKEIGKDCAIRGRPIFTLCLVRTRMLRSGERAFLCGCGWRETVFVQNGPCDISYYITEIEELDYSIRTRAAQICHRRRRRSGTLGRDLRSHDTGCLQGLLEYDRKVWPGSGVAHDDKNSIPMCQFLRAQPHGRTHHPFRRLQIHAWRYRPRISRSVKPAAFEALSMVARMPQAHRKRTGDSSSRRSSKAT